MDLISEVLISYDMPHTYITIYNHNINVYELAHKIKEWAFDN